MELGRLVMTGVAVAGIGAYWWHTVGRHGGYRGMIKHKFNLLPGEEIPAAWPGAYDLDVAPQGLARRVAGVAAAAAGFAIGVRGINFMAALTSQDRLVIGHMEQTDNPAPLAFRPSEVTITLTDRPSALGTMGGPKGLERTVVLQVVPVGGAPFRISIAKTAAELIVRWSEGAGLGAASAERDAAALPLND